MKNLTGSLALSLSCSLSLYAADLSDLTYTTTGDEVTITDCDPEASGSLVIPDTIDGKPVTSIGDNAFNGCRSLTHIGLPDSLASIGVFAFTNCRSLESATIPDSVTSIPRAAFFNCISLAAIADDVVTNVRLFIRADRRIHYATFVLRLRLLVLGRTLP